MENELRLGNLFILRGKIVEFDDKLMHSVIYGGLEGSEPIPLTEEWLLKFGFEETSDKDFIGGLYTRGKDGFYINKETMSYCGIDYEGTIDDIVEINYVHELQNLYFALTKQELTMK